MSSKKISKFNSSDKKPRILSLFSGCGGLDLGFHQAGYETVWANDFSHWACESFRKNIGDVIVEGDIEQIDLLRKYSSHRINQSCNQIYP